MNDYMLDIAAILQLQVVGLKEEELVWDGLMMHLDYEWVYRQDSNCGLFDCLYAYVSVSSVVIPKKTFTQIYFNNYELLVAR